MMNLKSKFFIIISMAAALVCAKTSESLAEDKKVIAKSAVEFAEDAGGELGQWADVMRGLTFPCGNATCSTATEKCIKCTEYEYADGWGFTSGLQKETDLHQCIGKNEQASSRNKSYSEWRWRGLRSDQYYIQIKCVDVDQGANNLDSHRYAGLSSGFHRDGEHYHEVCKQDAHGKKYCLHFSGETYDIVYGDGGKSMKGCEVLPVKLFNMRKCFFCPLFSVVFAAAEKMPYISFNKLAAGFATLIALGLAIWIAVQTLTHVSSLTKQDAPKFLAGLIKQSYKFLIAFLLLQNGSQIFHYAVNPVLEAGIRFGSQFLEFNVSDETNALIQEEINQRASRVDAYGYYISEDSSLPQDKQKFLYKELDGYVSGIQREIAFMQAVGSSLICTGNRAMFHQTDTEEFSDGFKMMLQGLVFAVFGFLLSIAFAFYMIDAVVQLGIVGALMPFLIASWPFKITSQYAGTGFKMLLNSAFIFVFIGLTVEINMQLINAALTNNVGGKQEIKASNAEDIEMGSLQKIAVAINEQDSDELVELTDISTMGFLILIFCCIFGFKFMGQTSSLAGQFSSGGIKPTAPSIATMGASAALSGAKKLTKPVREAVGRKAEDAEMAVIGAVAHPIKTAKSIGRGVRNIFSGKKGGGKGGESTESETETEEKKKKTSGSGTTESSSKKKSPVVGQKDNEGKKTESTQPGNGPRVGQKPAEGDQPSGSRGETPNEGGKPADAPEETGGSTGTTESAGTDTPENGGESVRPAKKERPQTASQKQRKYRGRKNRDKMQRNKQRRNYGRRHK